MPVHHAVRRYVAFPRLQKRGPIEASHAGGRCPKTSSFHAHKSVAPLKLLKVLRNSRVKRGFHAYKSVAALKPDLDGVDPGGIALFPRLQKRGPIEASPATWRGASSARFPRLQKRGPIEASDTSPNCLRCSCFHAYKSVAPLKLPRRLPSPNPVLSFHAYKSVAPLKLEKGTR